MRVSKWWQFLDDLSLYTSNQWYENYECASNMKLWSVIRYSPLCHSKPVKFLHWTQKKMFRMFKITFSMHQKQVNLKSYLNFLIFRHMITRLTSKFWESNCISLFWHKAIIWLQKTWKNFVSVLELDSFWSLCYVVWRGKRAAWTFFKISSFVFHKNLKWFI